MEWGHSSKILQYPGRIHVGTKFVVRMPQSGDMRAGNRYQRFLCCRSVVGPPGPSQRVSGAFGASGMYYSRPAGKSNHRMPFSICAVPAIFADKVYMLCTSGSHSRRRELIEIRMPLRGNFGMHGSYIVDAFNKDFPGTCRASAVCSTGTGDKGTPFSVLAVSTCRADEGNSAIAAASNFLRRYRISRWMPHSSNAGTFLCYRATVPAIPPLEILHGTTTPARLWMFSDFAIFTAVL